MEEPWITGASNALGVPLRGHVRGQAVGPCPRCGTGDDRFVVWESGNAWCRRCGHKTFWTNGTNGTGHTSSVDPSSPTREERAARAAQIISGCTDWRTYHEHPRAWELWERLSIRRDEFERYSLGFCERCPNDGQGRPSMTIPVWREGTLADIRHRIINADKGDKYRSHVSGTRPGLFGLDGVSSSSPCYLVEGEKKAIYLSRCIGPVVGFPGMGFLESAVAELSGRVGRGEIVILPDPDALHVVEKLKTGRDCTVSLWVVDLLPDYKPDDFLLRYGEEALLRCVRQRRPVKGR